MTNGNMGGLEQALLNRSPYSEGAFGQPAAQNPPPNPDRGVPPAADRTATANAMQRAYANNWQPNPMILQQTMHEFGREAGEQTPLMRDPSYSPPSTIRDWYERQPKLEPGQFNPTIGIQPPIGRPGEQPIHNTPITLDPNQRVRPWMPPNREIWDMFPPEMRPQPRDPSRPYQPRIIDDSELPPEFRNRPREPKELGIPTGGSPAGGGWMPRPGGNMAIPTAPPLMKGASGSLIQALLEMARRQQGNIQTMQGQRGGPNEKLVVL